MAGSISDTLILHKKNLRASLIPKFKRYAFNSAMKTISEIRLDNLKQLVVENRSQDRVATLSDTNPIYLSQLIKRAADSKTGRPRQIGDEMARKMEKGCGKEIGWMDNIHRYETLGGTGTPPPVAAEQNAPVYTIKPQVDAPTQRLLTLWSELDADGKEDFLGKIEFYVAGRRPHLHGQALSVAQKT